MRVVTNGALILKNRKIAQYSFFASLAILAAAFFMSNWLANNNPDAALFFNCVVVPVMFGGILFAVRMSNNWVREPLAWQALNDAFKGMSSDAVMYHYILPARHVLFCPQGVFTFTPLFQERFVRVDGDKWSMPGGAMGAFLAFLRQEQIGNPTLAARREADILQKYLDSNFPDAGLTVQPVIVFTHPRARADINDEQSIPVTFADAKLTPTVRDFVKSHTGASLTAEQIEVLDEQFIYAD